MSPPPIRFPLPTLILVVLLAVVGWWGRAWLEAVGDAVRSGFARIASGPPVPSSDVPMRREGGIVRKVLLLRDGVQATRVPDGPLADTIGRRIFADVYDIWPIRGEPTHYRIGNRRPIGWVSAADVLPWDTRLVLVPEPGTIPLTGNSKNSDEVGIDVDGTPLPVIDWEGRRVQVAIWEPGASWERIDQTVWVPIDGIRADFGVFLSRAELLELLRRSLDASPDELRAMRIGALLGRLAPGESIGGDQVEQAERAMPGAIDWTLGLADAPLSDRLGRLNDEWDADAAWEGIEYRAVPLEVLPGPGDAE
ncbi:hypothetical protein [Tautonia plasticadhaerens]|uniref:Uncharacterized protein n=1 Tax=Tautonia plasticadhaerens TaxID=2527974 RepID=A0A518H8M9_9BACT|nr:hypothetical protein [Tautonia plasticadhaerens]QDV37203.1 hypothetical protein ElP_51360 [Tautonia plasticadhaerens]